MNAPLDEPVIPPRLRRPLAAVWISLGLHGALVALVQVAPPAAPSGYDSVIEARLQTPAAAPDAAAAAPTPPQTVPPAPPAPEAAPARLAPSAAAEALPVTTPAPAPAPASDPAPAPAPVPEPRPEPGPPPAAAPPAPGEASPLAIESAVDLTYYSAREVDVHPRALREIVPDYPVAADRRRLSGTVRLRLRLEADGRVAAVDVVSATPPGLFEASALEAFRAARFSPAQRNGRPVRAEVLIEVVYDWAGRP